MSSLVDTALLYLSAIVFFSVYSVLYKANPLYRAIVSVVVGVGAAQVLLLNFNAIYNTSILALGDITKTQAFYTAALAIIVGLLYFTFFIPRLRPLYRSIIIITAGMELGIAISYAVSSLWGSVFNYGTTAFNSVPQFITMVAFALALSYFLFGKMLQKPIRPFRDVGRLILILYAAMTLPQMIIADLNMAQYFLIDSIRFGTWWIGGSILLAILLYAIYSRTRPTKTVLAKN